MERPLTGHLYLINYESVVLFWCGELFAPLTQVRFRVSMTIMSLCSYSAAFMSILNGAPQISACR